MSTLILISILAVVIVILAIWAVMTERRLKKFWKGAKGASLEDLMGQIVKQVENLKNTQTEINTHLVTVDTRLNKSIRKIETVRFNPFVDGGGNQSFAISFLNDEGDGVIISSLYARDRMSIFAKPIAGGKSEFELTTEEKDVLKKSK